MADRIDRIKKMFPLVPSLKEEADSNIPYGMDSFIFFPERERIIIRSIL
jgi:hypothetical protein